MIPLLAVVAAVAAVWSLVAAVWSLVAAFVGLSFELPFSSQGFVCACEQGHTASSVHVPSSLQALLLHPLADAPVHWILHR